MVSEKKSEMTKRIEARRATRRAIVGGVCQDAFFQCESLQRLDKQKASIRYRGAGGGACNHAKSLSRFGIDAEIWLLGQIGSDGSGTQITKELNAYPGIAMVLPPLVATSTSESIILCDESPTGHEMILSSDGARTRAMPMDDVESYIESATELVIHAHRSNSEVRRMVRLAKDNSIPVFVVPGRNQIQLPREQLEWMFEAGIEAIVCNVSEAAVMTRTEAIRDQVELLHKTCSATSVVVTNGSQGMFGTDGYEFYHVPAYHDVRRRVVNTTGAGDVATAAIVESLSRQSPLPVAMLAGVRAGYEACTEYGVHPGNLCTWETLDSFVASHQWSVK